MCCNEKLNKELAKLSAELSKMSQEKVNLLDSEVLETSRKLDELLMDYFKLQVKSHI